MPRYRSLFRFRNCKSQIIATYAYIAFICISIVISTCEITQAQEPQQLDLTEFTIHPDCKIELVAMEPTVVDPIAMRFDERGRIWVVEMRDYPTLKSDRPTSKIKILEDQDSDGVFETATVFADQLLFPTGLQPWKNGVIVTMEGKVSYLADHDGDSICDEEQVLFTGFAKQNTQLRANHPTLGIDGNVYVANGLRNGVVSSSGMNRPISISGMDFRFDPVSLDCEAVTGYGQFGLTFDDSGNRYTCTNRNPLKRIVFENKYLQLAQGIPIAPAVVDVAAAGPDSRLFPLSETWTTSNLHANQFTAACGVHIFHGDALRKTFIGNVFTCDPTANIVHREVIDYTSDSINGIAKPARRGVEFLASTHSAFRPVNLTTGPYGALYVVDMRREVIEHPDFMPNELKQWPDERRGGNLGRIYRIVSKIASKNKVANQAKKRIANQAHSIDELQLMLVSTNGWDRETAHRMFLQNESEPDFVRLRSLLKQKTTPSNSVIRILNILRHFEQLNVADLASASTGSNPDSRPDIDKAIVLFAEALNDQGRIRSSLESSSQSVRFQALLSSAKLGIKLPTKRLMKFAIEESENQYMRSAILLAAKDSHAELLDSILNHLSEYAKTGGTKLDVNASRGFEAICGDLANVVAQKATLDEAVEIVKTCLQQLTSGPIFKAKELDGTTMTLASRASADVASRFLLSARRRGLLTKIRSRLSKTKLHEFAMDHFANSLASDPPEPMFVIYALLATDAALLTKIAEDSSKPDLQLSALKSCQLISDHSTWLKLTDSFRELNSKIRAELFKAAIVRPIVAEKLIAKVKSGEIKVHEIDAATRTSFMRSKNPNVESLAQKHLAITISADRNAALQKYLPSIEMETNAKLGKVIFEKTCASCHQLGDLGNRIGPDISDTRTKTKSQLLRDIIMPNAAIDSNYMQYNVESLDGRLYSGIIVEENVSAVTLRLANNTVVKLNREDILQMASTGKSLMPAGLEEGLEVQQMANLLSFLKNWRYLDQNIPFKESDNAK